MKQKVRRHRGECLGLKEYALRTQASEGPPCSPPMCQPVAERQRACMGWLASGSPLDAAAAVLGIGCLCLFLLLTRQEVKCDMKFTDTQNIISDFID